MRETPVIFGMEASMVGIITDPPDEPIRNNGPAMLILNAGMIHHVGPNRLHVKLARRLAERGWTVMRIDLSGIGDSSVSSSVLATTDRAVAEVRQAMDFMVRERGTSGFVIAGNCSGAANSIEVARCDQRVIGAAIINPPVGDDELGAYISGRRYWKSVLTSPSHWIRPLTAKVNYRLALRSARRLFQRRRRVEAAGDAVSRRIGELTEHGIRLLFVRSSEDLADWGAYYKTALDRIIRDPASSHLITVATISDSDHVFTPLRAQEELTSTIVSWGESFLKTVRREQTPAHGTG